MEWLVSLFAVFILLVSVCAGLKEGAVKHFFNLVAVLIAIFIAEKVGIVSLIAKGYGALTWGYMLAFVTPVLTIGVYKIWKFKD